MLVDVEPLWNIEDVSSYLGVSVNTLYYWRYRGMGPKAIRPGKRLLYDPVVVRAWVRTQE